MPDLIAVLSFRLGAVDRVAYNLDEWASAPVELAIGGYAVHLDGHHCQLPHTVEVQDTNRNKMVLLVVPLQTEPDHAHAIVMAAAAPNNSSTVDTLLDISEQDRGQPHTSNCRTRALGFTGSRTKTLGRAMTSDPIFKAFNDFELTTRLPKQRFRGAYFVDSMTSMTKPPAPHHPGRARNPCPPASSHMRWSNLRPG